MTCWEFEPPTPALTWPAVTVPMTERVPVELLFAPYETEPPNPVAFPVTFIIPVEKLFTPCEPVDVPPVTFPVTFTVPVELLNNATAPLPKVPPTQFPVIVSVPVPKFATARDAELLLPVNVPTIVAVAGVLAENSKQFVAAVALLFVTFAVSVMPSLRTNFPVPALLISSQVVLTLIVTVCPVEARASSPVVGTTPPVQVAPALKLPLAAEVMRAMIRVLSR